MGAPLERRHTGGRRISDSRDTRELRGLLHDLGHEMSTLSFLVEAVRGDVRLPEDSSYRLELLSLEMTRLLDIIRHGLNTAAAGDEAEVVKVRDVVAELTKLARLAYPAEIELLPGPAATAYISPVLLWRVLSNVVDNAARAAGASGRVTLAVRRERAAVVPRPRCAPTCNRSSPSWAFTRGWRQHPSPSATTCSTRKPAPPRPADPGRVRPPDLVHEK